MSKIPNPIDSHVGMRLRMRRAQVGMSQEKLGDALGITFQQVQKYEKGTNRIGASRLQLAARVLDIPVNFFFDGLKQEQEDGSSFSEPEAPEYKTDAVIADEAKRLSAAFLTIGDPILRHRILALVEAMSLQSRA